MVTLVADEHDWVLGTMAASLADAASSDDLDIRVLTGQDWTSAGRIRPAGLLASSDLVHWLSTGQWMTHHHRWLAPKSMLSVHHIDETESWRCDIRAARTLVTHSTDAAERFGEICHRSVDLVLPYGFDPAIFSACDTHEKTDARRALGFDDDVHVVGCFGNAGSWRKDIPRLISWLRAGVAGLPLSLLVTGRGWDPYLPELESVVRQVVVGSADDYADMRSRYAALDVYLCSSSVEGGPYPVLEALACGVPAIATAVGHCADLIGAGPQNGRIISDDGTLVGALVETLGGRPPGAAAPDVAESVLPWSWPRLAGTYADAWKAALAGTAAPSTITRVALRPSLEATDAARRLRGTAVGAVKRLR